MIQTNMFMFEKIKQNGNKMPYFESYNYCLKYKFNVELIYFILV